MIWTRVRGCSSPPFVYVILESLLEKEGEWRGAGCRSGQRDIPMRGSRWENDVYEQANGELADVTRNKSIILNESSGVVVFVCIMR